MHRKVRDFMKALSSKVLFVSALSLLLMLAACGGSSDEPESENKESGDDEVASEEEFELRLATVVNPPHPWVDMGEFFAEEVEERTDGNVKVSVHHSATLGDDEEIIDVMLIWTIDFIV